VHVSFQTRNEKRTEITGSPASFTPITEEATFAPSKYRRCYQPADTYNIVDIHRGYKTLQKPDVDRVGFGDPDAMDRNGSKGEENGETKYEKVRTYSVPVRRGGWRRILRANLS
jgi:hypothetical protein